MRALKVAGMRIGHVAALAALACVFACAMLLAGAPAALADTPEGGDYQGGTIPIMWLTFHDTVDSETGEPITGDESRKR